MRIDFPRVRLPAHALALVLVACGGGDESFVTAGKGPRGARADDGAAGAEAAASGLRCDRVERDGDEVIEHERDLSARYRVGKPYTRTLMLFGGEPIEGENALSNAYLFGLDKSDARMLAQKYEDFYLCSSPGGMEAQRYIEIYDLVPANCDVYEQLVAAFHQYDLNAAAGGDRTSLRLEGAPLELLSVTADATGEDLIDQVEDQDFHLVTAVEQLTGQSVLSFGTSP